MVVGEHARDGDLEVNPVKTKHLTNHRRTSKEENVTLTPPIVISLDTALSYIQVRVGFKRHLKPCCSREANTTTTIFTFPTFYFYLLLTLILSRMHPFTHPLTSTG